MAFPRIQQHQESFAVILFIASFHKYFSHSSRYSISHLWVINSVIRHQRAVGWQQTPTHHSTHISIFLVDTQPERRLCRKWGGEPLKRHNERYTLRITPQYWCIYTYHSWWRCRYRGTRYKGINSDKCNNKCNGINAHYSEALRIKASIMTEKI